MTGPSHDSESPGGPLEDLRILDLSRLLPGAILARGLLDLGATLIKVESLPMGDMMRGAPPLRDGIGAGFSSLLHGAASWAIDFRSASARDELIEAIALSDVVIESFRPRTLASMGIDLNALHERCPRLISVSLPSARNDTEMVAHDLNLSATSGLLAALSGHRGDPRDDAVSPNDAALPWVQVTDVMTGQLALSALLAAVHERARTGRGRRIVQPLSSGALPFLTWLWADHAAAVERADERGHASASERSNAPSAAGRDELASRHDLDAAANLSFPRTLLAGRVPAYRVYAAQDGVGIALACVEPKFWHAFLELVGAPEWRSMGLVTVPTSGPCVDAIASIIASRDSAAWDHEARRHALPLSRVAKFPGDSISSEFLAAEGYLETPSSQASARSKVGAIGSWFPSFQQKDSQPRRPPALGSAQTAMPRLREPDVAPELDTQEPD